MTSVQEQAPKWHVQRDGAETETLTPSDIQRLAESGALGPETRVWRPGMTDWLRIQDTEIASLIGSPAPAEQVRAIQPNAQEAPADSVPSSMNLESYSDPRGLAKTVRALLLAGVVLAFISVWSTSGLIGFLDDIKARNFTTKEEVMQRAEAIDSRQQLIGVLELLLLVVTAVFFLRWVHKVNVNVRAFGAQDLRVTPGWAVGYFFVPVVGLWKPYQAMADVSCASRDPVSWARQKADWQVQAWWALWILSAFVGNAVLRGALGKESDIASVQSATMLIMADAALHFVLCLAALGVVWGITKAQHETATRLKTIAEFS